jgi:hypothetical protein
MDGAVMEWILLHRCRLRSEHQKNIVTDEREY